MMLLSSVEYMDKMADMATRLSNHEQLRDLVKSTVVKWDEMEDISNDLGAMVRFAQRLFDELAKTVAPAPNVPDFPAEKAVVGSDPVYAGLQSGDGKAGGDSCRHGNQWQLCTMCTAFDREARYLAQVRKEGGE